MFKHTTTLILAAACSLAACGKGEAENPANAELAAVVRYAVAADGGSMWLTVRTKAGGEVDFYRNFSLAAQNTPQYGEVYDGNGHVLTESEKSRLFARLNELKAGSGGEEASFVEAFTRERK